MASLIQQLQDDILNQGTGLSSVLRKAKVLAVSLGSEELESWVDRCLKIDRPGVLSNGLL